MAIHQLCDENEINEISGVHVDVEVEGKLGNTSLFFNVCLQVISYEIVSVGVSDLRTF